ncbi:hypothetical protein METP3_01534 [Methanosarcinales archaeon]|nr:hypothetical protein METP3_01534 [Methanosarcinales archaeon]
MDDIILISVLIFAAGVLYSSVGHAGASGYLAAMALFGLAPDVMKPTALVLNILVAFIAAVQFRRAGCFSWRIFWPFAVSSIPFAFIGGALSLPGSVYKQLLGLILLFAAYRLFQYRHSKATDAAKPVPVLWAVLFGAGIGLLSGAVGVGGGIFLSPLLLFMGWAKTKQTAGVSAAFILVNSIAGIAGHFASLKFLPDAVYLWAIAAVLGGIIGSSLGSRRFVNATLYRLLAVVLVIAGAKLMFV